MQFKENEQIIIKIITYILAINCIVYIVVQAAFFNGGFLEGRIDGNIGYANTYALLMVIALYFNKIRKKDNFKEILDLLFIQGILLTGLRNTLLYLGIFVVINIIYKKKKEDILSLDILFKCIIASFNYLIISKLRLVGILILPILLIIYYIFVTENNRKIINILSIAMIPIGIITMFSLESSLVSRITSASFNSSELQQRIGYVEDVVTYVLNNPLGAGINTYMYNQGSFQTGFYDVRYVHNSFGQALYDMGFLGLISFTMLFISGIIVIVKGKSEKKFYYLSLYLTIYLHSILDFDFAYMVIFSVVVMIVAFAGDTDMTLKLKFRYINIPTVIIGVYIFFITGVYYIGNNELKNGRYERAIHIVEVLDKVFPEDNSIKLLKFDAFKSLYNDTGDINYLKTAINELEEGEKNNKKSYVYAKLADAYEKLGDIEKSSFYYEKELELQKHAVYVYNSYCDMLTRTEEKTGSNYNDKKVEIMNRYYTIQNNRSEKSKKRFQ